MHCQSAKPLRSLTHMKIQFLLFFCKFELFWRKSRKIRCLWLTCALPPYLRHRAENDPQEIWPNHLRAISEPPPSHLRTTSANRPKHTEPSPSHLRTISEPSPNHLRTTPRTTQEAHYSTSRKQSADRARTPCIFISFCSILVKTQPFK